MISTPSPDKRAASPRPESAAAGNGKVAGKVNGNGRPQVATERLSEPGLPQRVLVTGGAGFIGTNIAARLAEAGCEVVVLDNLSRPGVNRNVRWLRAACGRRLELRVADIRDAQAVRQAVVGCDAVFHFAAQVAVTTSLQDPALDFAINAGGTLNVLEACRRMASPPPLLFTSTNKVYGSLGSLRLQRDDDRYMPADAALAAHGVGEDQPLEFHSPYGCSKGVADQYVLDYARCWQLPTVVFRMSCIYGPHQCGTEDQGWVAHFVRCILAGEPITFYGDGRQVRDVLFVEDLVRAMLGGVQHIDTVRGRVFNVGGGPQNAVSVREVVEIIAELHGQFPEVRTGGWRPGDQRYYVSDTRSLGACIGWQPTVAAGEGIARLYHWLRPRARQLAAV